MTLVLSGFVFSRMLPLSFIATQLLLFSSLKLKSCYEVLFDILGQESREQIIDTR